jgi:electron transfer flavoprotein beta subunit
MLASLLDWPLACQISKLDLKDTLWRVERETSEGIEYSEMQGSSVFTCDLRLNDPRLPKLPNIMKAKKMPLEIIEFSNLLSEEIHGLKISSFEEPEKRPPGVWVKSVDEMLTKIRERTNVL